MILNWHYMHVSQHTLCETGRIKNRKLFDLLDVLEFNQVLGSIIDSDNFIVYIY